MYHVCGQRTGCFEPYLLKMFWVHSNTFSLSLNASSVACYIQRAVQTAEQFMLFQIRHGGLPAPKCFLLSFNGTPHPLSSTIAGAAVVPRLCASVSHSVFQFLCYNSHAVIHVCSGISVSAFVHWDHSCRLESLCSAEQQELQCSIAARAVLWKCSMLSAHRVICVLWNSSWLFVPYIIFVSSYVSIGGFWQILTCMGWHNTII